MLPTALWMVSSRRISAAGSSPRMICDGEARPPQRKQHYHPSPLVHLPSLSFPPASALSPSGYLKSRQHSSKMTASFGRAGGGGSESALTTSAREENVMHWCQESCPSDVLPKILAFVGPKRWTTLTQVNVFWNKIVFGNDATWKCLSEELYKWKEGDELPTTSWRDFYCHNPCVPIDYSSIPAAMAIASPQSPSHHHHHLRGPHSPLEQQCSIKIWLRPGNYYLKEAMMIQASSPDVKIELETQELPANIYRPPVDATTLSSAASTTSTTSNQPLSPQKRVLQRARQVRNSMLCRSSTAAVNNHATSEAGMDSDEEGHAAVDSSSSTPTTRASLILRSRRVNEPLLRVRQGTISLTNVQLLHNSNGLDIWNGNAAIQVQPPVGPDGEALVSIQQEGRPRPTCILRKVDVTSKSGRGIVAIDGGHLDITSSVVHHCAATGIYVGGLGTTASILSSDVVCNGNGNRSRRGVPRGHSGIYLEQGHATVRDCNVSANSLTGISATSMENAILILQQSDLVGNGTNQLEMPPTGSWARRNSRVEQEGNVVRREALGAGGWMSSQRSGLLLAAGAGGGAAAAAV